MPTLKATLDHGLLLLSQQAGAPLDALRKSFEFCAPGLSVTPCQSTSRPSRNAFLAAASASGIRIAFMDYTQPVAVSGSLDNHALLFFTRATPLCCDEALQVAPAYEARFVMPGERIDALLPGDAPHFLISLTTEDASLASLDHLFHAQRQKPSDELARQLGATFQDYLGMLKYAGSHQDIRKATARLKSDLLGPMAAYAYGSYRPQSIVREIDPRLISVSDFIERQRRWDYNAQQLCKIAGMSLRGLYYGFESAFQTTPYRFYRSCKLARVRLALLTDLQQDHPIAWHATNEGFFHLSRFSTQYRLQFGELPSETVRQVRQRLHHCGVQPRRETGGPPPPPCSDNRCVLWRYCQLNAPIPGASHPDDTALLS